MLGHAPTMLVCIDLAMSTLQVQSLSEDPCGFHWASLAMLTVPGQSNPTLSGHAPTSGCSLIAGYTRISGCTQNIGVDMDIWVYPNISLYPDIWTSSQPKAFTPPSKQPPIPQYSSRGEHSQTAVLGLASPRAVRHFIEMYGVNLYRRDLIW